MTCCFPAVVFSPMSFSSIIFFISTSAKGELFAKSSAFSQACFSLLIRLRETLASLNLFNSYSDEPETIRNERLKTRIYLLLFSLALIAIIVYGALALRTTTITKYSPNEHQFEQLSVHSPGTTRCPCSRVSISFSEFIRLDVTYHPVCSSDFISQA